LADLGKVEETYFIAVNSVLQNVLSTVVVQTKKDALAAIEYFKKYKIGIITCSILEEINLTKRAMNNLKCMADVIHCDPKFKKLFDKYTSHWYITENTKEAMELSYSNSINGQIRRNIV